MSGVAPARKKPAKATATPSSRSAQPAQTTRRRRRVPNEPRPANRASPHVDPVGLEPPPAHAPRRIRTRADLLALQRLMAHALVRPLNRADDTLAPRWLDGRPTAAIAEELIKSNDRLTSVERLQIYARCYWYRITECVYDDSPGLRALLGEKKFAALTQAYLTRYPSRSFTLRNACERLARFISEEPRWTAPHTELAHTIARFEWAQTTAFDGASHAPLTPDDIADAPPARLRLSLQPHITLLALDWPVDDYVIAVKQREASRAEASNTAAAHGAEQLRRVPVPKRQRTYLAVHRYRNRLYYKRLSAEAFAVLSALRDGQTLARALGMAGAAITAEQVRDWFATWTELGWLCRREARSRK